MTKALENKGLQRNTETGRNSSIDVVKGICILFVIITHYSWSSGDRLSLLFPYWIDMAVPIFMIISGYVTAQSMVRNKISSLKEAYSADRIIKSFIRFTVPYIIALGVELLGIYIINANTDASIAVGNIPKIILTGGIGKGSYYYPIMIQFIFVFPVIYKLISDSPRRGLAICFAANLAFEVLKTAYDMNDKCYRLLVFRYILLIAIGVFISLCKVERKILLILAPIVGFCSIFVISYTGYKPYIFTYWSGTSMLACLWVVPLAYFLLTGKPREKAAWPLRPLSLLGKASYDIFFVQMVYYLLMERFIKGLFENVYFVLAANILICTLVGVAFYFIETPITKKLQKLLHSSRSKR